MFRVAYDVRTIISALMQPPIHSFSPESEDGLAYKTMPNAYSAHCFRSRPNPSDRQFPFRSRQRLLGSKSAIDLGVSVYHASHGEAIEHPLTSGPTKSFKQRGIICKAGHLARKVKAITSFEREPGITQDFNKGTQIRRKDGNPVEHVLRDDHSKNLSPHRRNNDEGGFFQDLSDLRLWHAANELDTGNETPLARKCLERGALGPIAHN